MTDIIIILFLIVIILAIVLFIVAGICVTVEQGRTHDQKLREAKYCINELQSTILKRENEIHTLKNIVTNLKNKYAKFDKLLSKK